jgi:hypothetical protein
MNAKNTKILALLKKLNSFFLLFIVATNIYNFSGTGHIHIIGNKIEFHVHSIFHFGHDCGSECNHKPNSEENSVFDDLFNPCFLYNDIDIDFELVFVRQIKYSEFSESIKDQSPIIEQNRAPPSS